MQINSLPCKSIVWKLKVPLKIKVQRGVILTKDNLLKRRWKGGSKCCFCSEDETIPHLFFDCHVAQFVWNAVFLAFGVKPPTSVADLFGSWLRGFPQKLRKQFLVGAAVLCWAIWLSRNDVVFNRKLPNSYLQVIFRGTHWRLWSQLSKEEEKDYIKRNCQSIEGLMLELFARGGWNFKYRVTY